jgi:hypothetical protein
MATETRSRYGAHSPLTRAQHGLVGGLVAGAAMGLLLQFVLGVMPAIGALYTLGDPSLTVGWVAHLVHSVLFGGLFAVAGGPGIVGDYVGGLPGGALAGGLFATALWAVNVVFLWPAWLSAVSIGSAPSAPYLAPLPLVGHLVYGLLLGGIVAAVSR